jgi:hypothetical protein
VTKLSELYAVYDALTSLTFEEFDDALTVAFGTRDTSYARGLHGYFQASPIAFMQSRQPQSQAGALLAAALNKVAKTSDDKDET